MTVEPSPSPSPTATPTPTVGAVLPDIPRDFPDEPFTLDEIGTQYYGSPQYEFVPSAEYGGIVPYIGGTTVSFYTTALVGFATLDGRVICEPIFSDCTVYKSGGITTYIARRLRPDSGVREDWLISATGAWAARYDAIRNCDLAFYEIYESYYSHPDNFDGYLSVLRDGKWGIATLAGDLVLPFISDYSVSAFIRADGEAFLITELSENWVDVAFDVSYWYDKPLGTNFITYHAPETTAHYFVNAAGEQLAPKQYVDYQACKDVILGGEQPDTLTDFDFGYTVPDGYTVKPHVPCRAHHMSAALNTENVEQDRFGDWTIPVFKPQECLDIDPPFVIYCTRTHAETRLPDGTVIVRRSLLDSARD
jgi:hypothetical protein